MDSEEKFEKMVDGWNESRRDFNVAQSVQRQMEDHIFEETVMPALRSLQGLFSGRDVNASVKHEDRFARLDIARGEHMPRDYAIEFSFDGQELVLERQRFDRAGDITTTPVLLMRDSFSLKTEEVTRDDIEQTVLDDIDKYVRYL